jgi:hypothetical protein
MPESPLCSIGRPSRVCQTVWYSALHLLLGRVCRDVDAEQA